jgi:hypothetical protein
LAREGKSHGDSNSSLANTGIFKNGEGTCSFCHVRIERFDLVYIKYKRNMGHGREYYFGLVLCPDSRHINKEKRT